MKNLEIKGVESKVINLTIRNCFYHGVIGKLKCLLYWAIHRDNKSFKDYLMSPVTYTTEIGDIYCSCDINYNELEKYLKEENNNEESISNNN